MLHKNFLNDTNIIYFLVLVTIIPFMASCADNKIKVACVGNSITYGYGLGNIKKEAYPSVLGDKLGREYQVKNFGHSGATALRQSDLPYWSVEQFQNIKKYKPDIIVFLLGTNDAKNHNYTGREAFINDYVALISEWILLESNPTIYPCTPPPVFENSGTINNDIISNEIIPAIHKVAETHKLQLIDFYSAFLDKPQYFPDKIHPDKEGSALMAEIVYNFLYDKSVITQ